MKSQKNAALTLGAAAVFLIAFNIVSFTAPFARTGAFWPGWGFTNAALIIAGVSAAFFSKDQKVGRFYRLPRMLVTMGYAAVQLVWGLVCMSLHKMPLWGALLGCVLALALGLLCMIGAEAGTNAAKAADQKIAESTFWARSMRAEVERLAGRTTDAAVRTALKELADDFRYSDPVSAPPLQSIEDEIAASISRLSGAPADSDVLTLCAEIRAQLAERNRQCKLLK